jgi:hypothetical protein
MDANEFYKARKRLGMSPTELGQALRLKGDAGGHVREIEDGARPVTGPISVAVEAMLTGWRPGP